MNKGKEKNVGGSPLKGDMPIENKYKVNYFFDENSKINLNEILKNSFLLSLKAEGKK